MNSNLKLFDKIKNELLYFGQDKEAYLTVRDQIRNTNRTSIITWSIFIIFFWTICLILALNKNAYASNKYLYIIGMTVYLILLICAKFLLKKCPLLINPLMYIFEIGLLSAGVIIAIDQSTARTATMIAFALIVPVALIDSTIITLVLEILALAIFIIVGYYNMDLDVYKWTITNASIFSFAGILVGHVLNKDRFVRYVYEAKEKKYAYTDQMTGLNNRRAFSEKIISLSPNIPSDLIVVMADLNGLKTSNDTYGHDAGDELIIAASECLINAFNNHENIYRIGGDEFCIIMHSDENNVLSCLSKLDELTSNWKGKYINGLSISCGYALKNNHDNVNSIIEEADHNMYEVKRNYYLNKLKNN